MVQDADEESAADEEPAADIDLEAVDTGEKIDGKTGEKDDGEAAEDRSGTGGSTDAKAADGPDDVVADAPDDVAPEPAAAPDPAADDAGDTPEDQHAADPSTPPTPVDTAGPVDTADAARSRLINAIRPRLTRSQLLAAVICAVLGFSIVVQARQSQVQSLASLRQSDLITVLDNVTQESARLDAQSSALEQTLAGMRSATDRSPAALKAAQDRLDALGVLAGTVSATGPGIELDISDPKGAVDATDALETVQELRDAGAEAMQIGSIRVVASTSFVDDPSGLLVDGTLLTPPYKMLVIGEPQTLAAALEIPGGVLEVLRNKNSEGVVHQEQSLSITALRQLAAPQYARPAQPVAP
jgi:uncharacterized protein YlxW (UPF0749 family)